MGQLITKPIIANEILEQDLFKILPGDIVGLIAEKLKSFDEIQNLKRMYPQFSRQINKSVAHLDSYEGHEGHEGHENHEGYNKTFIPASEAMKFINLISCRLVIEIKTLDELDSIALLPKLNSFDIALSDELNPEKNFNTLIIRFLIKYLSNHTIKATTGQEYHNQTVIVIATKENYIKTKFDLGTIIYDKLCFVYYGMLGGLFVLNGLMSVIYTHDDTVLKILQDANVPLDALLLGGNIKPSYTIGTVSVYLPSRLTGLNTIGFSNVTDIETIKSVILRQITNSNPLLFFSPMSDQSMFSNLMLIGKIIISYELITSNIQHGPIPFPVKLGFYVPKILEYYDDIKYITNCTSNIFDDSAGRLEHHLNHGMILYLYERIPDKYLQRYNHLKNLYPDQFRTMTDYECETHIVTSYPEVV